MAGHCGTLTAQYFERLQMSATLMTYGMSVENHCRLADYHHEFEENACSMDMRWLRQWP
jgi:hypothetical protein